MNALQNREASAEHKLLAILFVLDTSYNFIQLDVSASPFVVWKCDIVPNLTNQLK